MTSFDSDPAIDLGARMRRLRAARGLTLDALAGRAEVSRAMLSRIERGESSPTAQLLNKICGGLGITLARLFADGGDSAAPISRAAGRSAWRDPASGYVRRNVSPAGTGSQVDITEIEFPPGGSVAFDGQGDAGLDQHVWVLEGELHLDLDGDHVRLGAGDCLRMRFGRPVLFRNPGERPVRYAVIVSRGAAIP